MRNNIIFDFNKKIAPMKPLHGVCNGPLHRGNSVNLSVFFKQLEPPYVRLHDINWPHSREVDIHAIFPDFSKDPEDENSYDFFMTDKYLKAIKDVGSDIIYRLGESIAPADYKRFVHPPSDMNKWAKICIGIIKHYNHGWANGFNYNIKHWEIWNEPSVETMWTGTIEQYLELYTITAKAIRAFDPTLKICGPVACSADRITNKVFLDYMDKNVDIPLDVYTFHLYGNTVENTSNYLSIMQETFDKYERHDFDVYITEWNYAPKTEDGKGFWETIAKEEALINGHLFKKIGSLEAGCYAAGFLTKLQDSFISQANFFETSPANLFSCFKSYGLPGKIFYGLLAFKKVYDYENQIEVKNSLTNIYSVASANKNGFSFYLSNYKSDCNEIEITCALPNGVTSATCNISVMDETHDLEVINEIQIQDGIPFILSIEKDSLLLIETV